MASFIRKFSRELRCLGLEEDWTKLYPFLPLPAPLRPAAASPRASSRPFGGSNHFASLRQPPRASSRRDSSSRPHTIVPGKRREKPFSPRLRTGARTRRSGGWRLREFGSEGKMNIFLSSRYLILRFLLIPPGSSLWQPRLSTP